MSENMEYMQSASRLVSEMISLVEVYERGTLVGPGGFTVTLTPTQVNQLKATFATKRTECKTALDNVTG